MLDCRRVDHLRLRFPDQRSADLLLSQGVHPVARGEDGQPSPAADPSDAVVQFCVDRRGVWMQVCDGARGLHVNGRPVRRMAMLRAGDLIYLEGAEMLLLGAAPLPAPSQDEDVASNDGRVVLRGVGGLHHGRCFSVQHGITVGRASDCAIRIDEASAVGRHACLVPHPQGVVLRDLGSGEGSVVNGHKVRDALLRPGDQVVFDTQHRFVVEAPVQSATGRIAVMQLDDDWHDGEGGHSPLPASVRRMPWLLLAALLLAGGLSLLLLYGTR